MAVSTANSKWIPESRPSSHFLVHDGCDGNYQPRIYCCSSNLEYSKPLTDSKMKIHATVLTWSGIKFCMQSLVNRDKSWSSLVVSFFMWAALLLHVLEHCNSLWQADVLQRGDGWWVVFAQALSGPMTEILDRLKLFGEFKVLFLFFLVLDLHLP